MVGLIELGHLCIIKQWDNHLFTYARVSATFIATSFLFQHKDTMLSARPRGSSPPLHLPLEIPKSIQTIQQLGTISLLQPDTFRSTQQQGPFINNSNSVFIQGKLKIPLLNIAIEGLPYSVVSSGCFVFFFPTSLPPLGIVARECAGTYGGLTKVMYSQI